MDCAQILRLQQTEFFLLHNLVVDELGLLKRVKRITPAAKNTVQEAVACQARLFRSFLGKVFPPPIRVSKTPRCFEFCVGIDTRTREFLVEGTEACAILRTPVVGESGFLRFEFPWRLVVTVGKPRFHRRSRYRYMDFTASEVGIGKSHMVAKAVMLWKERLDAAVAAGAAARFAEAPETAEAPAAPRRNAAQEQLDAVLSAAVEAGRL